MSTGILVYLIAANVYVFFLMWLDYHQEKTGKKEWPVSEWQMMTIGLCGGGLGGALAMIILGHKENRKRVKIIYSLGLIIAVILFAKMIGWI
ncbi:DUF1294 domain-containing protein [Vagococcus zengguangii]|uniref:DUF1294 domain-containing protein n=1 Tax=Vagococcus zengguangii TaxID=2571750 RepID=A0A4D7CVY9_9ENTE|nr:DUF1294 domain-containing protein [Vagococcus zengguangii]QCI86360.1 DUF1294 domain-containing protein [Vagococcus zengguangii]TLG81397.1 DUF1294 domain-containing protein [Vagococcus zengguangii]